MILSGYKNLLDQLDLSKTASDLINKSDTRKHMLGVLLQYTLSILDFLWFDNHFNGLFTCVIILRFCDFALSYASVCISNIVMFPKYEKIVV